jgi:hypothetical protein
MSDLQWVTSGWRQYHSLVYYPESSGGAVHVATVFKREEDIYVVSTNAHFDMFIPPNAYILKRKFSTLEAAKRAVERKMTPLVEVLRIRGDLQL